MEFKKMREGVWQLEKQGNMRVPARVFANDNIFGQIEDGARQQLVNTAELPGIQMAALGLPDMHYGYGYPIGGVAAFDAKENGVVSPGGIGFDINCTEGKTKIFTENGLKRISDFEFGIDKVATIDRGKICFTFPAAFMKLPAKKRVFKIATEQGNKITATEEHPFLAKVGMTELKKIKESDEVALVNEKNEISWEKICKIKEIKFDGFVYDFTIPKTHNFIANSFVVSNCGIRLIRTNFSAKEIKGKLAELIDVFFKLVPAGVGEKGGIRLQKQELGELFSAGAKYMVEKGYGWKQDLERIEENGCMKEANPEKVSEKAFQRGMPQAGTLGSGNHFLEIQEVKEIFDLEIAKRFGLFEGQAVVMLHSGSRGAGHQIATDYLEKMQKAMQKYSINVPDRQLACAPIESEEGRDYLAAMACGINYAFANRQAMAHWVRQGFEKVFGKDAESMGLQIVYDICHNVAKFERHKVDGKERELLVHRKGATRAMPAGRKENPSIYAKTGHPAIVPGSMGTASYVLVGTETGLKESFASVCHGAGRAMSRGEAMRRKSGEQVKKELEAKGEIIKGKSWSGLAEEMPEAYKDIDEVVESVVLAGLGKKVSRHVPLAVMKG